MLKSLKKQYYQLGAGFTVGMLMSNSAMAQNTFSNIAENVNTSISQLPGLLTGLSYLVGTLLGVLGVLKIKDHVENPSQTPMKEGAIRLIAGGALFALPMIFEAMSSTIGDSTNLVDAAKLNKVNFNVQ